jgi:flagellar biosynthesis protein FliQ
VAAIFIVFLFTFPWALRILASFTTSLFSDFALYIK